MKGQRVKEIRKELGLSLEKFAEPLGVGRSAISKIENGDRQLTDQMAKSICREYNVDYFWLTEGKGDIFLDFPEEVIDQMIEEYGLSEKDKPLLLAFVQATPEQRQAVREFLYSLVKEKE